MRDICDMLKPGYNVGIAKDGFISNVKTPQKNKFQKKTEETKKLKESYENAKEKQMEK